MRSCSIEVTGHDLEPDEVTRRLGTPPARSYRRGDIRQPSGIPAFQGAWVSDSKKHVGTGTLEQHVAWAADFARQHCSALIGLRESGLAVRARIFWDLGNEVLSASLCPHDLAAIAACVEGVDLSVV
jgi:hypothetical protein